MIEKIVAIGICIGFAALVLVPIIKQVIKVEKYDDSQWYYDKKLFEAADRALNSKGN